MPLPPGTRLGPYEVLAKLGEGGMGEVYGARDTKLNRAVALKVLPHAFATDDDRLARFRREALVLAALNHPNIAHIYGLERETDTAERPIDFIVMELVEGPTLADLVGAAPIALDEALAIAKQLTEALETAHDLGIIHRDLKPANIKVRDDGVVKVLDFGLAKAIDQTSDFTLRTSAGPSMSPTLTSPGMMTGVGVILGTAAYMSPEQAKGKSVDERADIWAFGCVLYEMLTGKRTFDGEDVSETIAAILRGTPDWTALPPGTPPAIARLLRRCLTKDVRERLHDIADARLDIQDALAAPAVGAAAIDVPRRRREGIAWTVCAAALLTAASLGILAYLRPPPSETPAYRAVVAMPPNVTLVGPSANRFALSPDGRRLAFIGANPDGKPMLWMRPLDGLVAQPLVGTEGADAPFWSPDSRFVGFFTAGKLKRIDAAGGLSVTVCDYTARNTAIGATWNQNDVILFSVAAGQSGIQSVPASGGTPSAVTAPDRSAGEIGHVRPFFLPDGRHFLYMALAAPQGAGAMRSLGIYAASLDSRERKLLVPDGQTASYAQGQLLFLRGTTVMAQALDLRRLEMKGAAAPVAEQVQNSPAQGGPGLNGAFSVSETGTLVYQAGATEGNRRLVWFDRTGKQVAVLGEPGDYREVALSPDRKRVAVSIVDPATQNPDIWLFDVARSVPSRLTFDPSWDFAPIWSPDGGQIVFASRRGGGQNLYVKAANRAGDDVALLMDDTIKMPASWSPDGRFILYTIRRRAATPERTPELWILPLFGDRKPFPLHHTVVRGLAGQFSPDGRWIAYGSAESGRSEVYVTPFPGPGGKFQVSVAGGGPTPMAARRP